MISIGVDAHKHVHAAVAVDDAGRELGQWRGPNSKHGWHRLAAWCEEFGPERHWGIEGAWSYGRGLAQHLVSTGETVYEINSRWTAFGRRRGKRADKSDRLDARAVALFVRQEAPALPVVRAEDDTAVLDLLCSEREGLLVDAGRLRNQLHALLMQIDPEYQSQLRRLDRRQHRLLHHGQGLPLVAASGILWNNLQYQEIREYHRGGRGLGRGLQFVRYDARGTGLSDRHTLNFTMEARQLDLEAVVERWQLTRFALLGAFHGATTAVAYAARHRSAYRTSSSWVGTPGGVTKRSTWPTLMPTSPRLMCSGNDTRSFSPT